MKIALFGQKLEREFLPILENIISFLEREGVKLHIYDDFKIDIFQSFGISLDTLEVFSEPSSDIDMLFSLGGDGTFLRAANLVGPKNIPILGINIGRLGFLADVSHNGVEKYLRHVVDNNFLIENRTLVELISPEIKNTNSNYALNELGVFKTDTTSMLTVKAYVGDTLLTTYWSDGLILSTPTGSTAYSLSAGGAILSPDCKDFIISPLSPHNLTMRPIIIPDNKKVRMQVECRESHFLVSLDSCFERVPSGTEIVAGKADFTIKIVKFAKMNFYKTLQNKLMWGVDKRNR